MRETWTEVRKEVLRCAVRRLYAAVKELDNEFRLERRKFTLDGHLLGSIGEVVAAYAFDLDLLRPSARDHDAKYLADGRLVQVKLTGGNRSVSLYGDRPPQHLLVLQLSGGIFKLVYNGLGENVWPAMGKKQKNGQRSISLSSLRQLDSKVESESRLPQVRRFPDLDGETDVRPISDEALRS